ncbi:MAG TPA: isocitrate dehydrogenase [Elusimicrobia bacterium]|nr:MAG: isocitrate dehydrogenase [Elusimicrobia bacterium RIFOXYA12_FULL_49_49]OGS09938.1 MAG: isocitrate dehydrogenase [Elusimicrobia bacterium RIFOXYA1_FULL_47_7]OGS11272.1 MAG: isocitrate dehydrogenase [Elusimicrobia bacterium RIFOXYB1_FULL_48_9]OGS15981.1 MAG: isocitrate dehydrogenase [Elusimicrobia bacterium RIFOXYA2_FULL_47_53]OGS26339.1 MAG: isocitrate dehydrogenase [Elusimicrobia bacterium RIFOXYB12_FULL_50_12]OGS29149.1 MAG: isocitrate dehydrogenase [Elusimicrobia bacterium RIFOXYB2_F
MAYNVTLIPGDGTGPDLAEVTARVIDATGVKINWEIAHAGVDIMEKEGTPLPESTLNSIRKNKVALKGPITTPIGTGFRSVNVAIRKELDLYTCLRPCKTYKGVRSKYENIDLVVVRENTEDLYAGVEFAPDSDEAKKIIELSKNKIVPHSAISIKPISREGSRRLVKFAFDYAAKHNRKKVTAVTKANIMKFTDGLFFEAAREVAKEYEGKIEYEERLIDNMCMQLVQKPNLYDVIALPNLYGDILSDLCAGLIGGLGIAPGANFGKDIAVFEAVHGSAPKYKGMNKVNPTALILSGVLMLEHLGEIEASKKLEKAVAAVIAEGKEVTYDLGGTAGTKEMGQAIIAKLKS